MGTLGVLEPQRVRERLELDDEELAAIDALDTGMRGGPDPDSITLETFGREIPEA